MKKKKEDWIYLGKYNSELEAIRLIRQWEIEEKLKQNPKRRR